MSVILLILAIIVIPVILFGVWFIHTSNNLIARRNRMEQCSSSICVMLKQRNDMLPNMVAVAKAYMGHENQTLVRITELRAKASDSKDEQEQIRIGNELSALLPKLQLTMENYPELKANVQFQQLHISIEDMELQLQAVRRTYNAAVVSYNNYIEMFPSSWVARRKGYSRGALIDIPESEKQNVDMAKLFNS